MILIVAILEFFVHVIGVYGKETEILTAVTVIGFLIILLVLYRIYRQQLPMIDGSAHLKLAIEQKEIEMEKQEMEIVERKKKKQKHKKNKRK